MPFRYLMLAMFLPFFVSAQEAYREKIDVTWVEIPVTVIGRDGAAVRGLTRDNFEILEGSERRTIETFDVVDFAAERPLAAVSPLNPASRRYFLLLFDLSYATPTSILRAQTAARDFIARSVGDRDLVAVASADVERGTRFLTAFTTDRNLLLAAISEPVTFRTIDPLQISSAGILASVGSAGAGGRADVRTTAEEVAADIARNSGKLDDAYSRARVRKQVETLAVVARALRGLAGRKHLVLLSEGFDPRLVQGRGTGETRELNDENRAIQHGEIWKVDSDKRYGETGTQRTIDLMAEEFKRSDVVLHAVDIQGLRVQNDTRSGSLVNSNEGLFLLSSSTGGTVFRNSNDISGEFDRLTRQHEVVYVLGFHAPRGRAGEFHDLRLRLVDVPNARAHYRGGYYDPGDETPLQRSLTNAEIIVNDIPQDGVAMDALAMAFPTGGADSQVPVMLELPGSSLLAAAGEDSATLDFFVYAFDPEGTVRGTIHQRVGLEIDKLAGRLRESGVRFYGTMRLPSGRYALKCLVRVLETEARGFRRIDIDVPVPGDVAVVRPIFFDDPGSWIMIKGGEDPKVPYPFVLDGESFVPAARASLRPGEPRLFTVFVYNSDPEEISWQIRPEATLVSTSAGEDVTKYLFALERVPPGATELDVVVRRKGSQEERRVTVPIDVQ